MTNDQQPNVWDKREIITLVPDIDEFGTRPEPGKITLEFDEELGLTVRVILTPEVAECLKTHLAMALEITDKHRNHVWDDKKGWVQRETPMNQRNSHERVNDVI